LAFLISPWRTHFQPLVVFPKEKPPKGVYAKNPDPVSTRKIETKTRPENVIIA
jgi:hypothetical protein